jgi:hypothetical protein
MDNIKIFLPMSELVFVDLTNWHLLIYADERWWHMTYASSHLLLPPRTCHWSRPPVSGEGHPRGQLLQQQAAAQGQAGLQPSRCFLRIAQPLVVLPALHLPVEVVDFNFNQFKLAPCNSTTTNTSDLIFLSFFICVIRRNFCVVVTMCLSFTFSLLCLTGWGCIYNLLCLLMAPVIYTSRYVLVLGHYWFVIPIVWTTEGHLLLHQVLLFLMSDLLLKTIQNLLLNQYFLIVIVMHVSLYHHIFTVSDAVLVLNGEHRCW